MNNVKSVLANWQIVKFPDTLKQAKLYFLVKNQPLNRV